MLSKSLHLSPLCNGYHSLHIQLSWRRKGRMDSYKNIRSDLSNLEDCIPSSFTPAQRAETQTLFYKKLALAAHAHSEGKMQTFPKVPGDVLSWYNVWYTPGVSLVSTTVRDKPEESFRLSNRSNLVAVVSDSTRVLGDGDVGAAGGLGVMEGKAMIMKQLGGVDAVALCIDSRDKNGKHDPKVLIDFVKRVQHSFGAINLEDISQPNCYRVLDELRNSCDVPVWHDDQQGTACVTLAALMNSLRLAGKDISTARFVYFGAGSANTTSLRLLLSAGADPRRCIMFDSKGSLHKGRKDIQRDTRFYRKWEICTKTNPNCITDIVKACTGADALVALSRPGPNVVKPEWIRAMAEKPIVFACANPVPEIYPHDARKAGAFIVATGRGDYPNQVNNSICFPGMLKGVLLARARSITDGMAISAAKSIAGFAWRRGVTPDTVIPRMDEHALYPTQAADVAMAAVREGVARETDITWQKVYDRATHDISVVERASKALQKCGAITAIPRDFAVNALKSAIQHTLSKQHK